MDKLDEIRTRNESAIIANVPFPKQYTNDIQALLTIVDTRDALIDSLYERIEKLERGLRIIGEYATTTKPGNLASAKFDLEVLGNYAILVHNGADPANPIKEY